MKFENELSKEQILERYLNHVYLGHGYHGIKTAAKGYFRKELDELTLKEIAILVGFLDDIMRRCTTFSSSLIFPGHSHCPR